MEMEMEVGLEARAQDESQPAQEAAITRLEAATAALENATERLAALDLEATRDHTLATRLAEAEATITQLRAAGSRRAISATGTTLQAKEGHPQELNASTLDAALTSLSLEQRIAVKSQLLRAGLLG